MLFRPSVALFSLLLTAYAAEKTNGPAEAGNELVEITGTCFLDHADVVAALGMEPGLDLVVVDIKVAPRGETKLYVSLDDFVLISRKDGQRSQPMSPGQIAGSGAVIITDAGPRNAPGMGTGRSTIGGIPGIRGRRKGGSSKEAPAAATPAKPSAPVTNSDKGDNPLLAVLKAKILPEKETNEPVSGQLYFVLEGKHKLKDLDLLYKTPAGRLELDFLK